MDQLSLFPTTYECNMRKIEIWNQQQKGESYLTNDNLHFLYETIEMMMELKMCVTTEIDWALADFKRAGWNVESKYIEYAIKTAVISINE